MQYRKTITLGDGRECVLRNGTEADGAAALRIFLLTHEQTDFLASYPDECTHTVEGEAEFLREKTESEREIELLAEVDGTVVGLAGIHCVGPKYKTRHRAGFGISIDRAYWGLGIGRALTEACIACFRSSPTTAMRSRSMNASDFANTAETRAASVRADAGGRN